MYYPCSENKGADQLRGNREADLRLCFRICKKPVFSRRGSYVNSWFSLCNMLLCSFPICSFPGITHILDNIPRSFKQLMTPFSVCTWCIRSHTATSYNQKMFNKKKIIEVKNKIYYTINIMLPCPCNVAPITPHFYMSHVVRKPAFCICENKDADQLRGQREADQRLCFCYTDSTIPLLHTYEISSL